MIGNVKLWLVSLRVRGAATGAESDVVRVSTQAPVALVADLRRDGVEVTRVHSATRVDPDDVTPEQLEELLC